VSKDENALTNQTKQPLSDLMLRCDQIQSGVITN